LEFYTVYFVRIRFGLLTAVLTFCIAVCLGKYGSFKWMSEAQLENRWNSSVVKFSCAHVNSSLISMKY